MSRKASRALFYFLIGVGIVPFMYFLVLEIGIARAASGDPLVDSESQDPLGRYVENVAFGVNEKLHFDINYGFINAGYATMEVAALIEYENRPCYQVVTRAFSNNFFSNFFRVEDRVESLVDAIGLFSWRFEKNLREGGYKADKMYSFGQKDGVVYYEDSVIDVGHYAQDVLSSLYFMRTQELKPGQSVFINNFTDGKQYPLEVKVLRTEKIKVDAGEFECLVVEPLLQAVGIFKHEGSLTVWLTNDRLKMPVLMKTKVLVGSISAELTRYELGDIEIF